MKVNADCAAIGDLRWTVVVGFIAVGLAGIAFLLWFLRACWRDQTEQRGCLVFRVVEAPLARRPATADELPVLSDADEEQLRRWKIAVQ